MSGYPSQDQQYSQYSTSSQQQPSLYTRSPPPLPPPKTGSQQAEYTGPAPPPAPAQYIQPQPQPQPTTTNPPIPAIEDYWLPEILQDKSKPDLKDLLSSSTLLSALVSAPSTTHPSVPASQIPLQQALSTNTTLAQNLNTLSTDLSSLRSTLTARLLSLHALERQWRNKQSSMDNALEPWSPKALHARLVASIGEQEMLCRALEESFLEASDGKASERDVQDWIKRYREGRVVLGLRKERRARFEEGRVGGWR